MKRLIGMALLAAFAISPLAIAKEKESSVEKAIKDETRDNDHSGKGKGRPDNPGEHGRQNAAEKQSRGHGNGSKKGEGSWEGRIGDELEENKKKDKDKDKKNR